jgi:membrane protein DedA with SNARE-associated domain
MERQVLTSLAAVVSSGPPPVLPGFLASLTSPLEHYGLWAVALFVLVEDFGIPLPGETVLIAGAVFAGSGRLNVVAVGIVGFLAAVAGDNVGYAIGRFGGRALVERWGRYVFLTSERLDKAERFFARHGGKIIVLARFIEGLRQANGIIAGLSGMRWLKFLACNALGAALWVGTWVSVGYFAGQHITSIYDVITRYSLYAAIAAVAAIAGWLLLHLRKRRRTAAAPPSRAAGPAQAATGKAAQAPDNAAGTPDEAAGTPDEAAGTPGEPAKAPGEAAGAPGNGAAGPDKAARTPDEAAGAPGNGAAALDKAARTSGEPTKTPDQDSARSERS